MNVRIKSTNLWEFGETSAATRAFVGNARAGM